MKPLSRRARLVIIGLLGLAFLSLACTPEQLALSRQYANYLNKDRHVISDSSLAALRQCESGGNYGAVSPGGTYRGAYQFSQSTWDAVASRHFSFLVGDDPAATTPARQDAMARALYSEAGRSPWPVCGQYI